MPVNRILDTQMYMPHLSVWSRIMEVSGQSIHGFCQHTCQCGFSYRTQVWKVINATRDPHLKEDLINGSLIHHTCLRCGVTSKILYECIYYDDEREFVIWLIRQDKHGIFKIKKSQWKRFLPPSTMDYQLRVAKSFNHMIETIITFEAGLSDVAVILSKEAPFQKAIIANLPVHSEDSIVLQGCSEGEALLFVIPMETSENDLQYYLLWREYLHALHRQQFPAPW